jgi:Group II intron, maturase-specific domain
MSIGPRSKRPRLPSSDVRCPDCTPLKELKPYIVGWRGYFGFCQTPRVLTNLEAWIRRRLRLYLWRQWRTRQNRFSELRRRGVAKFAAAVAAGSPTGLWRMSGHPEVQQALRNDNFASLGLPRIYEPPKPNSVEPPLVRTRMPGGVGGVASRGVPLSRSCANSGPDRSRRGSRLAASVAACRPTGFASQVGPPFGIAHSTHAPTTSFDWCGQPVASIL